MSPAEQLRKAARPAFCAAAVQAYAALLKDHENASLHRKPLLTQAGLVYLRRRLLPAALRSPEQNGMATASSSGELLPYWDTASRRLWLGTQLLKEFRQPAPHQAALLDVFQEEGWASGHIDDPLPRTQDEGEKEAKRRLHETIKNLNRGLEPGTIRFRGDGTGQGIVWEYDRCRMLVGRRTKGQGCHRISGEEGGRRR